MSAKKAKTSIPPDKLALYDKLIATIPEIERKGAGMPYTSFNGHMFTLLEESGTVGIRLGKADREAFLQKYNTTLFESYGTIMKEYVAVPAELLQNTDELQPYLALSFAYVKTLKPKAPKARK